MWHFESTSGHCNYAKHMQSLAIYIPISHWYLPGRESINLRLSLPKSEHSHLKMWPLFTPDCSQKWRKCWARQQYHLWFRTMSPTHVRDQDIYISLIQLSWCGSVGWSIVPCTKGSQVQFPVRAHAWVADLTSSWSVCGKQLIGVRLSLINKYV